MRTVTKLLAAAAIAALAFSPVCARTALGDGPPARREPYVGYVYPAGGRAGTSFRVRVGGANLNGLDGAVFSGGGVRATLVRFEGGLRQLNGDQRKELRRRLDACRAVLRATTPGPGAKTIPVPPLTDTPTELPDVPIFRDLGTLTLAELDRVEARFLDNDPRRQPNAQISETAVFDVSIDADAAPGDRVLRLTSRLGVTNGVRFEVGLLPEIAEEEPRVVPSSPLLPERAILMPRSVPLVAPPVVLNGQILPGDADRYRILAPKGQRLVVEAHARRLVPFLADAVPGWFQATLSLRDARGREVAFADDFRFDPDPVLLWEVPEDGEYLLEIGDALRRGREDFVYRIRIGEEPFVTSVFPLGVRAGSVAFAEIGGFNLPSGPVRLDSKPGVERVREAASALGAGTRGEVAYAVDTAAARAETEPNGALGCAPGDDDGAERISLPVVVDGRIGSPGDVDVFRFDGHLGQEVVIDVEARRLGSPLDGLVRLIDETGAILAWNDDFVRGDPGIRTHDADPYLRVRLPKGGAWRVQVSDSLRHGGDDHGYRLRIGAPREDFVACVSPASVNLQPGGTVPVRIHVVRRDGFDGEVAIAFDGGADGLELTGARVPAGQSAVWATLTAARGDGAGRRLAMPRLTARASVGGAEVSRAVVPVQDVMQAFAYRHLLALPDLVVAVAGAAVPPVDVEVVGGGRVRLASGGTARLRVALPRRPAGVEVAFELIDPPPGVTIAEIIETSRGADLVVAAAPAADTRAPAVDGRAPAAQVAGNLLIEASWGPLDPAAAPGRQRRRASSAYLPAIPFELGAR